MSEDSTARDKHNDVEPNEEFSVVALDRRGRSSPPTSNMRIRTATGRVLPPRPAAGGEGSTDDPGSAESANEPVDAPPRGHRDRVPSSTTEVASDRQERTDRPARSRRWVQLSNTTTRTSAARGTDRANVGDGITADDDTKP